MALEQQQQQQQPASLLLTEDRIVRRLRSRSPNAHSPGKGKTVQHQVTEY